MRREFSNVCRITLGFRVDLAPLCFVDLVPILHPEFVLLVPSRPLPWVFRELVNPFDQISPFGQLPLPESHGVRHSWSLDLDNFAGIRHFVVDLVRVSRDLSHPRSGQVQVVRASRVLWES